ncbi:MAG: DNA recombination protein RmuC [Pseudomonadota bacterium]
MTEFLQGLDPATLVIGSLFGLLLGLLAAVFAWRSGARRGQETASVEVEALRGQLAGEVEALGAVRHEAGVLEAALAEAKRDGAVLQTRLDEQQAHFDRERALREETERRQKSEREEAERRHREALEQAERQHREDRQQAERRLKEQFENLAGSIFEERSKRFTELSNEQLGSILKPLTRDLEAFRGRVDETHREEVKQHAALREKLTQLEGLNQRLNQEAQALTKALTGDVKTQGGWGEQQLEKLLELSGLVKGEHYQTQVSVTGRSGERLQPDLVLSLPEQRSIIIDSKVSLTAWTRYQAAEEEGEQERELDDHVKSLRAHIDGLARKNYADAEELNALDFVLMFVPIESALIAALRQDPDLPEYALKRRVALLSPSNFLATVRTVASIWMVHKQNTNARDIAERAGRLYDKFVGFTDNLKGVGMRLDQAQRAYDGALSQLSEGRGNLLRQVEDLRKLGARHQKQLDAALAEKLEDAAGELEDGSGDLEADAVDPGSGVEEAPLKLVKGDDDAS